MELHLQHSKGANDCDPTQCSPVAPTNCGEKNRCWCQQHQPDSGPLPCGQAVEGLTQKDMPDRLGPSFQVLLLFQAASSEDNTNTVLVGLWMALK